MTLFAEKGWDSGLARQSEDRAQTQTQTRARILALRKGETDLSESIPPPVPKLSSTILLLQDGASLEVLMVERHYEIDFAAGALVFPGGKACEDDSATGWNDRFDGIAKGEQRAAQIAAIRELYEEAGILLVRPEGACGIGAPLAPADVQGRLNPYRAQVDRGERKFSELCAEYGLVLAGDLLIHFGHWITPTFMPKRFDTHFYLAALPEGQVAEQDGREATDAVWLNPHDALAKEKAGAATIIFPTRMNLGRLGLASSVDEAMSRFAGEPVITVLPVVDKSDPAAPCLIIPDVEGYGQTREPISRVANVARQG